MSVLDKILAAKRQEVAELKSGPGNDLKAMARQAQPVRNFLKGLKECNAIPIIAEIKKASPSAGALDNHVDVAARAETYQAAGAAALSVLTDGPYFNGSLEDLKKARASVDIPILRKDFIIDPLQIYQARAAGADAILLIAAALDPEQLKDLFDLAGELDLTALIEVHDENELPSVLELNPKLVGINNRNLKTLGVDIATSLKIRPQIPQDVFVVCESGINNPEDVARLNKAGLDAFLIGTTLMKSPDPAQTLRSLAGAEA